MARAISILGSLTAAIIAQCAVALAVLLKPDFAIAQTSAYSAAEAPAAWRDYAQLVQARLREWLVGDDVIRPFQEAAQNREGQYKSAPKAIAKLWISAEGRVERANIIGLNEGAAAKLRAAIEGQNIGAPPPADMLLPLNLRLSIGDKE
jgi:hypothetical protein